MTASSALPSGPAFVPRGDLPRRIHQIIDPWASRQADAPALLQDETVMSFGQLDAAVAEASRRLAEQGLRAGDRLLLVAENSIPVIVLALACSRLDAWLVPVNARLSQREIDTFIEHSGARLAAFTTAVSADAEAHAQRLGAVAVDWPGTGRFQLTTANAAAVPEPVVEDSGQVAALIYTSGTSGAPKAVMLTHRNLLFIAENGRCMRRQTPADRVYAVLPLSHIYGLATMALSALHAGASLMLAPRFDPALVAAALDTGGVTILHGVPAMYAKLLEWGRRPGHRLRAPSLRIAQGGGAPLDQNFKDDFEAVFGITLHNGYGMTEASPSIAQTRLDAPRRDCSVGPPIPGIEIRIVKDGAEVAPGGVGELHLRGPGVMKGYYKAPEMTREAVDAGGWLNTGDLARQDSDSALFIVGRSKELIIRSGFNVYPIEVEQAINSHPDVVHCAVVGRFVPGNEEVVAYVELVPGRSLAPQALVAWLHERLSPYKIPSHIELLEHLPATATGKILKNQLRQMAAAQPQEAT
ncbi:MAG: AMP-binding protein [Rhodocyclales bacterium]|nr:AMP-binding protein [Rhodocyclales bacterium]